MFYTIEASLPRLLPLQHIASECPLVARVEALPICNRCFRWCGWLFPANFAVRPVQRDESACIRISDIHRVINYRKVISNSVERPVLGSIGSADSEASSLRANDDVVRTPTLDWLAETGVVFENAYTPAPSCIPARHSMRTGQLPRTGDRFGMEAFESSEYRTLPLQMARHGYMTASGGKEHYPGWDQHQGWRKRIGPTPMKQHGIGDGQIPDPAPGAGTGRLESWDETFPDRPYGGARLDRSTIVPNRIRRSTVGGHAAVRNYSTPVRFHTV